MPEWPAWWQDHEIKQRRDVSVLAALMGAAWRSALHRANAWVQQAMAASACGTVGDEPRGGHERSGMMHELPRVVGLLFACAVV